MTWNSQLNGQLNSQLSSLVLGIGLAGAIALVPLSLAFAQPPGQVSRLSVEQRYNDAKQQIAAGQYDAAIALYEATLAEARHAAPDFVPFVLGNLAIAYRVTGQYQQAIASNQAVITLFRQQGNAVLEGRALSNLGNVYEALGNYEQAQQAFEQAQSLAQQTGDRAGQTLLWNSLGVLAAKQGQPRVAIAAYQRSLDLATESGNLQAQASSWLNLGDTFHAQGKLSQAMDYYNQSLTAAQSSGNRTLEAEALGSLGVVHSSRRDFATAIERLEQSLALFEMIGDRARLALTLNNLAHAHYNARAFRQAEVQLRRSLTVLDGLRQGLSDLDKVSIFDTQTKTYNLLQQVLSSQSRSADALEVAEWGRARAFADLLNQRLEYGSDASATVKPPEIEALQRIARDRQATLVEYTLVPEDDFLHQGKQMGIPEAIYIWVVQPDGQVHQRRADLKPLIAQQQPLELLVQASRCFDSALMCQRQRQRQMRERAAAGSSRGFSFNAPEPAIVVEPSEPKLRRYDGLQQLHQLLIEPIVELLPDDPEQQVIVIPQGELFWVPFPALQDQSGEFLIAHHTLLTAPSIQTLALTAQAKARLPQRSKTAQDFLVVGNPTMPTVSLHLDQPATPLAPLPGAEAEAIAIAQMLNTEPLLGAQAKESAVLQRLAQAHWIHLATHGLLSYGVDPARQTGRRPVPGAIALAMDIVGTTTDGLGADNIRLDGLLTSSEIINLRLNAELVVLSACDTGRGDLTGDGVVGLARAWMGAGVPSVVVSLWAVSDASTAALMQAFYGNLAQGMTKAQALRQAMLTTSQTYPNPSDWSAFTLLGEAE